MNDGRQRGVWLEGRGEQEGVWLESGKGKAERCLVRGEEG